MSLKCFHLIFITLYYNNNIMSKIITKAEVDLFKKDGAVLIKGKFDNAWIEKLKVGINKAKINPSPRFTNHTKDEKLPSYLEDF